MPQQSEPINGGESPLASTSQSTGAATAGQPQSGSGQLDGGPAPTHVAGQLQQNTVGAAEDQSGVAPTGGIVRPM